MRRATVSGLVAVALAASACGLIGGGRPDDLEEPVKEEITLNVENQNFYGATLYAVAGSHRERLGVVEGFDKRTFEFRWAHPEVQIEIDLLAGNRCLTERMTVVRGDVLDLVIDPALHRRPASRGLC